MNPYLDRSREQLYDACHRRAAELMQPAGPRSAEDRAALAQDTGLLLLALAQRLSVGAHLPNSPLRAMREGSAGLADAFLAQHAAEAQRVRYQTWIDALQAAFGALPPWELQARGADLYAQAMASDDGLAAALRVIEARSKRK